MKLTQSHLSRFSFGKGPFSIGIAVAAFNEDITTALLEGAKRCLSKIEDVEVTIVWVPGAFELPLAAQHLGGMCQAVICLGCVIRGDTPHFDYVCEQAAQGIMQVSLNLSKPVAFGVITVNTHLQALDRAQEDESNKGYEAAASVLAMLTSFSSNHET